MSAHDGERSPKRQRLDSYSPASPRPSADPAKAFVPNYSTPPPSVRMSPSWTAQSQTSQQQQPGGSNFPSPPSTADFHHPTVGRGSETGGESGHQTPASQDECEVRKDGDGDSDMVDRQESVGGQGSGVGSVHRRSDHERQGSEDETTTASSGAAVQHLYKLHTTPIAPARPLPSQNWIELYGLSDIQRRVARLDPAGNKIKLRKSYASKIKNLGLEGVNKAEPNNCELQGLVDPLWSNETQPGHTMWDERWKEFRLGDETAETGLLSRLDSALQLQPGRLPKLEHEQWKKTLGLDEVSIAAKSAAVPKAGQAVANAYLAKTAPLNAMRNSAPSSPRNGVRSVRTGKKRSYGDSSFEGYGEGFEDDGYSTGGVDDAGRRRDPNKRQKRKEFPSNASSPAFTSGGGSMVGVGVRSS